MGKRMRNGVEFGGSSDSAERIKLDDTHNVKTKFAEVDDKLSQAMYLDTFDELTGVVHTTSEVNKGLHTADEIIYDETMSVKDKIDEVESTVNEMQSGLGLSEITTVSFTQSSDYFTGTVSYQKQGNIVFVTVTAQNVKVTSGAGKTVIPAGTLPIPTASVTIPCVNMYSEIIRANLANSGALNMIMEKTPSSTSFSFVGSAIYFCKE